MFNTKAKRWAIVPLLLSVTALPTQTATEVPASRLSPLTPQGQGTAAIIVITIGILGMLIVARLGFRKSLPE